MLIKRIIQIIGMLMVMISMVELGINLPFAAITTFTVTTIVYLLISIKRSKSRISLLYDKCDPEAFLERTENQIKITGKNPKFNAVLNIDKAAALMYMGEAEEAKRILTDIDKSMLSKRNGAVLIYTINLIVCLYDLGEIAEADELYEKELIKILQDCILSDKAKFKRGIKGLIAEREFIQGKYEESKKNFEELYEEKASKCHRIGALHGLARINEKLGEREKAIEQYTKIIKLGNKLYAVKEAKERLAELKKAK